jgi:hypothetical protein
MNTHIVFFSALFLVTTLALASKPNEKEKRNSYYGHMLPQMSPRTCQEYLEWVRNNENQQNKQSKPSDKQYALRCSNEISLKQSSGSIGK